MRRVKFDEVARMSKFTGFDRIVQGNNPWKQLRMYTTKENTIEVPEYLWRLCSEIELPATMLFTDFEAGVVRLLMSRDYSALRLYPLKGLGCVPGEYGVISTGRCEFSRIESQQLIGAAAKREYGITVIWL